MTACDVPSCRRRTCCSNVEENLSACGMIAFSLVEPPSVLSRQRGGNDRVTLVAAVSG